MIRERDVLRPPPPRFPGEGAPAGLSPATEIRYFRGVGPARAEKLRKLGLRTCRDLLHHLPHRYADLSRTVPLGEVRPGETVTVRGRVLAAGRGPGRIAFEAVLGDATGSLRAVWFGARLRAPRVCVPGRTVVCAGPVKPFRGEPQLVHPTVETPEEAEAEAAETGRILPVYPGTEGLPPQLLRRLARTALAAAGALPDPLPEGLRRRRGLAPLAEALRAVHAPASLGEPAAGRERLAYEELLLMQVVLALRRRAARIERKAVPLRISPELDARIRRRLRFPLTPGQEEVLAEIRRDLEALQPMNRLLQGDVGSGKTLVAAWAMLAAVGNGAQAALLAPTEVLAEQHHRTLSEMLRGSRVRIELLEGGRSKKARAEALKRIASGEAQIAVATHALLTEDVRFGRLALLVVDEQQRFGVRQKAGAVAKGVRPDVLVMTATPIPRTLALTLFGDLDVSTLRGFPPGRAGVETRWLRGSRRAEADRAIRGTVAAGGQAYVVAPRVGDEADPWTREDVASAERLAAELRGRLGPGVPVGLLHGRLSRAAREGVMEEFRGGRVRVLAATTVVEVGVDVPAATLLVVENADRFGLAQLHQLRGRVGRGGAPGTCLLVADPGTPEAEERLRTLVGTSDGFRIAEEDLRLRGPGEMFGVRQSGMPELRVARLPEDSRLLLEARDDAAGLVAADPALASPPLAALRAALAERFEDAGRLVGIA
ncbi:MAG: ATP-dependent DNA helicase RecG [Planctomycetales bacterium]|nr:ATP-dependent DNA helicase RecG [Planctomycetales bacterium]